MPQSASKEKLSAQPNERGPNPKKTPVLYSPELGDEVGAALARDTTAGEQMLGSFQALLPGGEYRKLEKKARAKARSLKNEPPAQEAVPDPKEEDEEAAKAKASNDKQKGEGEAWLGGIGDDVVAQQSSPQGSKQAKTRMANMQEHKQQVDEGVKGQEHVRDNLGGEDMARLARYHQTEYKSDWETAKDANVKGNPPNEARMWNLISMRKTEVDQLVSAACQEVGGFSKANMIPPAGSVSLTSDYDVSLQGPEQEAATIKFNKKFRDKWGRESLTVFDSNVYTAGSSLALNNKEQGDRSAQTDQGGRILEFEMDVYSLIMVRKNMKAPAWQEYTSAILDGLDKKVRADTSKRFLAAEESYANFLKELYEMAHSLLPDYVGKEGYEACQEAVGGPIDGKNSDTLAANLHHLESKGGLAGADLLAAANNRAYEGKIKGAGAARNAQMSMVEKIKAKGGGNATDQRMLDALTIAMQSLQSEALLYANEAYFTPGAVQHIVGKTQMEPGKRKEKGADFKEEDLMPDVSVAGAFQSFQEQYGYATHYLTNGGEGKYGTVMYKASKYVDRAIKAADLISLEIPRAHEGDVLTSKLLDVKRERLDISGLDLEEGASTDAQAVAVAKKYDPTKGAADNALPTEYHKWLTEISVALNLTYRKKSDAAKQVKTQTPGV